MQITKSRNGSVQTQKTPLWHELDKFLYPTGAGGWNRSIKKFDTILDYDAYLNSPGIRSHMLLPFLDGFTGAVELGQFDETNWFMAFEHLADWKCVAEDLLEKVPLWLSERVRNALSEAFKEGKREKNYCYIKNTQMISSHTLGDLLLSGIDWSVIAKMRGPLRTSTPPKRVRAAKPRVSHLQLVVSGK